MDANDLNFDASDLVDPDCARLARVTEAIAKKESKSGIISAIEGDALKRLIRQTYQDYSVEVVLAQCPCSEFGVHWLRSDGAVIHLAKDALPWTVVFWADRMRQFGLGQGNVGLFIKPDWTIAFLTESGFLSGPIEFWGMAT